MKRKKILCFGDSNTYGVIPEKEASPYPSDRYDENTRWPCVMQKTLGIDQWDIIEEGLGGRTTMYKVPGEDYRLSDAYLLPCLLSHRPLDYVVLMVGINDIQPKMHPDGFDYYDMKDGIKKLIHIIKGAPETGAGYVPPKILLVCPTFMKETPYRRDVFDKYGREAGIAWSQKFPAEYHEVAEAEHIAFLHGNDYAEASIYDGIHLTPDSHIRLGRAIAGKIRSMEAAEAAAPQDSQKASLKQDIEM